MAPSGSTITVDVLERDQMTDTARSLLQRRMLFAALGGMDLGDDALQVLLWQALLRYSERWAEWIRHGVDPFVGKKQRRRLLTVRGVGMTRTSLWLDEGEYVVHEYENDEACTKRYGASLGAERIVQLLNRNVRLGTNGNVDVKAEAILQLIERATPDRAKPFR